MTKNALPTSEITAKLRAWNEDSSGDPSDALIQMVYDELHKQAYRYLQKERVGHTLQTTALVHEAYLRLAEQKSFKWESRSHFFAIAATIMRRILIDYAKSRQRVRRGGVHSNLPIEKALTVAVSDSDFNMIELDEVLTKLGEKDKHLARVVELRFFSGLDVVETANVLGISESTVKRDWQMAKAWLHRELTR